MAYEDIIHYAQEKFVMKDGNAAIVRDTRYYKYSDSWHYDSAGYLDFGEKMALAIAPLSNLIDHYIWRYIYVLEIISNTFSCLVYVSSRKALI